MVLLTKNEIKEHGNLNPEQDKALDMFAASKKYKVWNESVLALYGGGAAICLILAICCASVGAMGATTMFLFGTLLGGIAAYVQGYSYLMALKTYAPDKVGDAVFNYNKK